MIKYPSLFFTLLISISAVAQTPKTAESKATEVKLFFQGAEVKRNSELRLEKGKNEILIPGLSSSIDVTSVNLGINPSCKVVSAYIEEMSGHSANEKSLEKALLKLEELNSRFSLLALQKQALEEEKRSLINNSTRVGTAQGINLTDLDQTLGYMRKKQEEINLLILKKEAEKKEVENATANLKAKITLLEERSEATSSTLHLTIESENPQVTTIHFTYYLQSCAWAPFYNIFNKGAGEPLDIEYKAHILNNSGEDWIKVKLALLPGNPAGGLDLPEMETWTLGYSQRTRSGRVRSYRESGSEGNFSNKQMKNGQSAEPGKMVLREIEIEEGFQIFEIAGLHDIPNNNHAYKADIARFTRNASYYYKTIPKIESKAYLLAQLQDWEDMRLIEGEANVYSDRTFMGRTYIDPMAAGDTLEISLGPDPGIQITRVKKKDKSKKRFIGTQLTESLAYEIDIRNLNKKPVYIEVIDQIPVAQQSDIQISLDEAAGAEHTENIGRLSWKLEVPPVNTAKLRLGYSVKYPRDKVVKIKRTGKLLCPSHFW